MLKVTLPTFVIVIRLQSRMGTLTPKDPDYVYLAPSKEVVIADRAKPYDVKVNKLNVFIKYMRTWIHK